MADQHAELKESKNERLQQMRAYADTLMCRREHLLRHFGDEFTDPCNNCDNCDAEDPETGVDSSAGTRRGVA